jgi:ATP-dependent phosphoenolpyruvate carboxykinase
MQDLSYLGIRNLGQIHHNLSTPALYEEAVRRREGWFSHLGPLVVRTGQYTGRSAEDKFVVREPTSEARIYVPYQTDPVFGLEVPTRCPDVPSEVLNPRNTWSDPKAYDEQARKLAELFAENFKEFEAEAAAEVIAAGPRVG